MRDMAHHPERAPQAIPTAGTCSTWHDSCARFQSLTGPTSHSNIQLRAFQPVRMEVSIPNGPHKPFQHEIFVVIMGPIWGFQSLTGPTRHSNSVVTLYCSHPKDGFNP